MRSLFVLLFGVFFLGCAARQEVAEAPPVYDAIVKVAAHDYNCVGLQKMDQIRDCLIFALTQGDRGGPTSGTAWFVTAHYVVTAMHVALYSAADPASALILTERHPISQRVISYTKVQVDKWMFPMSDETDFAIGYIEDPPKHETIPFCSQTFAGEGITAHGYPMDASYELSTGFLIGEYGDWILTSNKVRGGFSGGPLISDNRKCSVGVIEAATSDETVGVPYHIILEFILDLNDATAQIPKTSR